MAIPLLQKLYVGSYVVRQHLAGRKRYPLVLMLEPLFRCNLACAGCGKIDYPDKILNQRLSVEECLARGRRMRRAGGLDRRRRAADPQRTAGDRRGHHRAQEIRLSLHQCAADGEEAFDNTSRARISSGRCISTATARCTTARSARRASTTRRLPPCARPRSAASASASTARCSTTPTRSGWRASSTA